MNDHHGSAHHRGEPGRRAAGDLAARPRLRRASPSSVTEIPPLPRRPVQGVPAGHLRQGTPHLPLQRVLGGEQHPPRQGRAHRADRPCPGRLRHRPRHRRHDLPLPSPGPGRRRPRPPPARPRGGPRRCRLPAQRRRRPGTEGLPRLRGGGGRHRRRLHRTRGRLIPAAAGQEGHRHRARAPPRRPRRRRTDLGPPAHPPPHRRTGHPPGHRRREARVGRRRARVRGRHRRRHHTAGSFSWASASSQHGTGRQWYGRRRQHRRRPPAIASTAPPSSSVMWPAARPFARRG